DGGGVAARRARGRGAAAAERAAAGAGRGCTRRLGGRPCGGAGGRGCGKCLGPCLPAPEGRRPAECRLLVRPRRPGEAGRHARGGVAGDRPYAAGSGRL
ncbi:MAG: hypothetical protein AVDCRST_MAG27-2816, partial [uncultured Craurococcus sp.]